ncbi:LLM class flavin-dependent oxidoreductase [Sabulicella glaciei]|uniref:LLM class flavin-dependent oxidoreductase n=1 Tax=Sabulicella glaciei TaxID=2984948 RepID=A0ABT3NW30_9PROT|nr:LLM class flavin-dependent oxidoreductase [Roseococcus sp. MDT2-1-1]MCW8086360.1 LLM class flavin-dependent oxidoreductase [Roseococcus sp. MDT2-1-1]
MLPRLSILDQSTVVSGRTPRDAIGETLALAQLADRLGYARYWLAEHHNSASHAGSAPEILIAAIAATTQRIRIGSAGVMLPHYAALKVAEQFRALEAIAPGRIDLGVGRAPGSDGRTAYALNPNAAQAADAFPAQVRDLLGWLGDGLPEGHPFREVRASPAVATRPEVWVLGSSDYGAQLAAYFGLPYCFAHFITEGRGAAEALHLYREGFRGERPHAGIAVYALTAETEEEAQRLFLPRALWRLHRDRGHFPPLPTLEEAEAHPWTQAERDRMEAMRARALVGTPERVRDRIAALATEMGAQEVAVLTPCHDAEARRRSVSLLAGAFGLG